MIESKKHRRRKNRPLIETRGRKPKISSDMIVRMINEVEESPEMIKEIVDRYAELTGGSRGYLRGVALGRYRRKTD